MTSSSHRWASTSRAPPARGCQLSAASDERAGGQTRVVSDPRREGDVARADEHEVSVASHPRSIMRVRRHVVDACARARWSDSADTAALLVSEVATNALLHAYGREIRVRVLDHGRRLRGEVSDDSPTLPAPRNAVEGDEGGRGMLLGEALAVAWGVEGDSTA